jgi:hypothetical protein
MSQHHLCKPRSQQENAAVIQPMADISAAAPSTCWIEVAMARDQDGVVVVTPQRRRQ